MALTFYKPRRAQCHPLREKEELFFSCLDTVPTSNKCQPFFLPVSCNPQKQLVSFYRMKPSSWLHIYSWCWNTSRLSVFNFLIKKNKFVPFTKKRRKLFLFVLLFGKKNAFPSEFLLTRFQNHHIHCLFTQSFLPSFLPSFCKHLLNIQ